MEIDRSGLMFGILKEKNGRMVMKKKKSEIWERKGWERPELLILYCICYLMTREGNVDDEVMALAPLVPACAGPYIFRHYSDL